MGTLQLRRVPSVAALQDSGAAANRTSLVAGSPVPSFTSVKESVTDVSVTPATARSVTVPGLVTVVTATDAAPCTPSLVAVIEAKPAPTAVTSPLGLTVATALLLDAHVTVRPVRTLSPVSLRVAASCCVAPTWRLAFAGLTVTDATGTGGTVIAAVPLLPSLVAVIAAEPVATAGTTPPALTVATAGASLAHVTERPMSVSPRASFRVAVSCGAAPTVRVSFAGATVTDATGAGVTVIAAVPLLPSLVAVIAAEPVATAVTTPLTLTVATAGASLAHVTERPVSVSPRASLSVAVSCGVAPTRRLSLAGATVTDATGVGPAAAVVPLATSESEPNTALTFSVPRNATI